MVGFAFIGNLELSGVLVENCSANRVSHRHWVCNSLSAQFAVHAFMVSGAFRGKVTFFLGLFVENVFRGVSLGLVDASVYGEVSVALPSFLSPCSR